MPDTAAFIQEFGPWLLVFNRVLGVFMFTPLLASGVIPAKFRALLAAAFSVAVYGFLPSGIREAPEVTLAGLAMMMFGELLIGACIGFIAGLPLVAMEISGQLIGYQMALSLAQSYNPELDSNLNSIGSMLFFLGISAFVILGGPETVLMILTDTFSSLPIGGFSAEQTPVDLVLSVLTAGTEIALRVAAPAIGVIMASLVAMGFVMKSMPSINVLSVGFAVYIIGGLLMLLFALFAINDVIAESMVSTLATLADWVRSLAAPAGAA